jgi:hypothetical protein
MNRFSDEYAKQEVAWYSLKEYKKNGIKIHSKPIYGRQDEYFNKRFWIREFDVPVLFINDHLWMSITPLEVQSMALPIERAMGKVGTGGLGMGYFALKCAEKDVVSEVKVWETNADVIQFFTESFSHRKGFEKIKIIQADVRDMRNESFSYFFMDIYQQKLPDVVFEDMDNFKQHNKAGIYDFWCQDWPLLQAVIDQHEPYLLQDEAELFMEFDQCPYPDDEDTTRKVHLYSEFHDDEFMEKLLTDYMGRI